MSADPSPPAAGVSSGYRRYALWLLLVIYTLNFLDRQVVNILAEPIKRDLGLADWQLGMLTGLSFAVFYTVLGIPIARLAERANRVWIISAAVGVWSFFTALSGLAANFAQLLLARIGVGVGEAGCSPPAHSLITDYTPKEKRASALAFYSMGIPLGSLAGMALGGLVADAHGWRVAFFVAGAPGLLIALIAFFTLKETRDFSKLAKAQAPSSPSLRETFAEVRAKPSFWWIALGAAVMAFIGYGHIAFYGSFYFRNHASGLAELSTAVNSLLGTNMGPAGFLGTALGLVVGVFGATGTFLGGQLADRAAKSDASGYATVPAVAALVGFPVFALAMTAPGAGVSILLLGLPTLFSSIWYGPVFASVQSLVQPQSRATAAALLLFIINLVGLGFGPLVVGAVSDLLAPTLGEADAIRWSLIGTSVIGLAAAVMFWAARKTLGRDIVG